MVKTSSSAKRPSRCISRERKFSAECRETNQNVIPSFFQRLWQIKPFYMVRGGGLDPPGPRNIRSGVGHFCPEVEKVWAGDPFPFPAGATLQPRQEKGTLDVLRGALALTTSDASELGPRHGSLAFVTPAFSFQIREWKTERGAERKCGGEGRG